jgi:hypothetical protein
MEWIVIMNLKQSIYIKTKLSQRSRLVQVTNLIITSMNSRKKSRSIAIAILHSEVVILIWIFIKNKQSIAIARSIFDCLLFELLFILSVVDVQTHDRVLCLLPSVA